MDDSKATGFLWGCGALVVVGILVLVAVLFSGAQVNAGYVGVVSQFGAIDTNQIPLAPGFHVVMPFTTHIESVSIQPQNHTFNEVGTGSKELQNVYVDGGVNYHVNSDQAAKVLINGGVDAIVTKVFNPAFQDYIKEIVPQYNAEEVLANRAAIRDSVKAKLAEKAAPYGLTVDDVFITNIHFDKDYTAAIEAKQVAQQKLEQAKIDAQTVVTQATGQANAKVATAKGDAAANDLLTRSITPTLIQYLEITRWDGHLPQVTGGGGVFVSLAAPSITK